MAIYVRMNQANTLISRINKKIDKGEISTWAYDNEGDYTHLPVQWINEAWITYKGTMSHNKYAVFGIIPRRQKPLSKTVYAVYHGRFTELLLKHFDDEIEEVVTTASLIKGIDVID
mgnify:CR=1 FL=1